MSDFVGTQPVRLLSPLSLPLAHPKDNHDLCVQAENGFRIQPTGLGDRMEQRREPGQDAIATAASISTANPRGF
ncbi:MAG: hypothetical protein EOO38_12845 [Cytophagaceae bacterium]|nr:MAG: hypothetical protein EOO38_12845 [Cytophagaceae bacterium]